MTLAQVLYIMATLVACSLISFAVVVSAEIDCGEGLCEFYSPVRDQGLGFCITRASLCDGKQNCRNGTDELNCETHVCEPRWFKCDERICKSHVLRCDGKPDCEDGTDENDCENYECINGIKCFSKPVCIASTDVCDGSHHCDDKSDEEGCYECKSYAKKCGDLDSECVRSDWRCDGKKDCTNGEDEATCDQELCRAETEITSVGKIESCSSADNDDFNGGICQFGMDGIYCNETCTACRRPFCRTSLENVNRYYKLMDYQHEESPPCIPKNAGTIELKHIHISRIDSQLLTNVSSSLEVLRMNDVTHDCMDNDFLEEASSKLLSVYLNRMNFTQVTLPMLKKFKKLSILNLDFNAISFLPEDVFEGTDGVVTLSLSNNRFKSFSSEPIQSMKSLFELHLSFNFLTSDINFSGMKSLRSIDLSHNCIEHIPETMFLDLLELKRIFLQGNSITHIPLMVGVRIGRFSSFFLYVSNEMNCSSVTTQNETTCNPLITDQLYPLLELKDIIDNCENETCTNGEDCTDVIGGFECESNRCGNNECFLKKVPTCSTSITAVLQRLDEEECTELCVCGEEKDTVVCKDGSFSTLKLTRICLPRGTKVLKLFNISMDEPAFISLLSKFDSISKLDINSMSIDFLQLTSRRSAEKLSIIQTLRLVNVTLNGTFLVEVPMNITAYFKFLKSLEITYNKITSIHRETFSSLQKLQRLNLSHNEIIAIHSGGFNDLENLVSLDLAHNKVDGFGKDIFLPLLNLEVLNISRNLARSYHADLLQNQTRLRVVHGDLFTICCLIENVNHLNITCTPQDDISSCERLIGNEILRILIWIQAVLVTLGNITVIALRTREHRNVGRSMHRRTAKINIFLVGMLGFADLFMCVYLFVIAAADEIYAGKYFLFVEVWLNSAACQAAGVLAIFSGEASVLLLSLITLTRLLSVVKPLDYLTVNVRIFYGSVIVVWVFAGLIAFAPLMGFSSLADYFSTSSATCLPSFYTSVTEPSWIYSFFVVLVNLLCLFMMLVAYSVLIYVAHRNKLSSKGMKSTKSSKKKPGSKLNIRVAILVITDMICWMPVCIIALYSIALGGLDGDLHSILYPVTAIVVLPINSTLNPVIYTLMSSAGLTNRFKAALSHLWSDSFLRSPDSDGQSDGKYDKPQRNGEIVKSSSEQCTQSSTKDKRKLPGIDSGTSSTYLSSEETAMKDCSDSSTIDE